MSTNNRQRTAIGIFAAALLIAIIAAFLTTLHSVEHRQASNDAPPGMTGLARPHPPLDRSPGQALPANGR